MKQFLLLTLSFYGAADDVTLAPLPDVVAIQPSTKPSTPPPTLSPVSPTASSAPTVTPRPSAKPTISPAPSVSAAPSAKPTISKAPTISPAPTSIPTAFPTDSPRKDRDKTYVLAAWIQAILSVGFFLLICCPCLYCFNRICIQGKRMPDLGGVYAHQWYDENRGYVYLLAAIMSCFNFAALYFASMAGADDERSLKAFGLAAIVGDKDTMYLGFFGFANFHEGKPDGYWKFNKALPGEGLGPGKVDYDYEFTDECKKFGKATFSLIIPAGLLKCLAVFCAYKRVYVTDDAPEWRMLGTVLEFGCFVALLGATIEFFTTCFEALPNRGSNFYFPDPDPRDDETLQFFKREKLSLVAPYVSSMCVLLSAFLSLVVSWIHFRTPCWESEVADPEWEA